MRFPNTIKLYRKFRYRKGFGVHSPFTYNLITKVIEERSPYYAFEEIERFRRNLPPRRESRHRNYGALLFRTVRFLKCQTVLQIGAQSGVLALYISFAAKRRAVCYALEETVGRLDAAKDFAARHNLENLHLLEGPLADSLQRLKTIAPAFDMIFVNLAGDARQTETALALAKPFFGNKSAVIIDGIYNNKGMQNLWKSWQTAPEARVTVDLFALGMIFLDKNLHKQYYKIYFNYGKKQNLHRRRRQRKYFLSRWKKNPKKQSAN
jgi:predicted O-methyltransferase YrrM